MGWRRNIVRCLMLATLVVAASTSVNAARPGFLRGWRPPRIQAPPRIRVPPPPVQRPPIQNHGLSWGHGYGSVNAGNAEHMRAMENINRKQIHPSPGYDSYPYRQRTGSNNMGTIGSSTRDTDYGKSVRNAASNAEEKPVTAPPCSKNNYRKSSNTNKNDKILDGLESLGKIEEMPEEKKEVGRSYPNSDREESTTVKNTNVSAGDTDYSEQIPVIDLSKTRMETREERSSTRDRVHGKSVHNAASTAIEKPVTAAPFSKNKYQKSSNTNDDDEIIRTIENLRTMLDIPEAEKDADRSYPNSDQEESTAMKIAKVNVGDGKKPWVMVTTPDWTWYFEIEGTWYVVRYTRGARYSQVIPSTNSSHTSGDEEGIRRREIRRLIKEDVRKAPMIRRG